MKKIFTFFILFILICAVTRAQNTEVKPNYTFQQANFLPFGNSMTGLICYDSVTEYYKMVIPNAGTLRVATSVATVDSVPGKPYTLSLTLYSNEGIGSPLGTYSVKVGDSISVNDTLSRTCLAGDTIYLGIYCTFAQAQYCFNYTFSCFMELPAFSSSGSPNHSFATAAGLTPGSAVQGQLGFKQEASDTLQPGYYLGVLNGNGELQIYTDVDYSEATSRGLNVMVYNNDRQLIDSLEARIGLLGTPAMDTLIADCMPSDTFYLRLSQNNELDCGWSYNLSYNLVPPVYSNDIEPNNNFAEAQIIAEGDVVGGNAYYGADKSNDYFKFYKPDSGFLQVLINAESNIPVGKMTVYIYDYSANLLDSTTLSIGTAAQVGLGELYEETLAKDSFYLRVVWPVNGHCGSYSLQATSSTVSSVKDLHWLPVSVMPNPSTGDFTFNLSGFHITTLQVYAIDGRQVESITGERLQNQLVTLGGELETGMYVARLMNGSRVIGMTKLVKTR